MRRTFYLFFLLYFNLGLASAQNYRWGITAGLDINKVAGDCIESDGMRIGSQLGLRAEYDFSGKQTGLYLTSGLNWSQKGMKSAVWLGLPKEDGTIDEGRFYNTLTINFLEMPVSVGCKFGRTSKFKFLVEGGPRFSLAAWSKETYYRNDKKIGSNSNAIDRNNLRHFDMGIGANVGILYNKHFQFIVGYDHGLLNMAKPYAGYSSTYRNRSIITSISYMF